MGGTEGLDYQNQHISATIKRLSDIENTNIDSKPKGAEKPREELKEKNTPEQQRRSDEQVTLERREAARRRSDRERACDDFEKRIASLRRDFDTTKPTATNPFPLMTSQLKIWNLQEQKNALIQDRSGEVLYQSFFMQLLSPKRGDQASLERIQELTKDYLNVCHSMPLQDVQQAVQRILTIANTMMISDATKAKETMAKLVSQGKEQGLVIVELELLQRRMKDRFIRMQKCEGLPEKLLQDFKDSQERMNKLILQKTDVGTNRQEALSEVAEKLEKLSKQLTGVLNANRSQERDQAADTDRSEVIFHGLLGNQPEPKQDVLFLRRALISRPEDWSEDMKRCIDLSVKRLQVADVFDSNFSQQDRLLLASKNPSKILQMYAQEIRKYQLPVSISTQLEHKTHDASFDLQEVSVEEVAGLEGPRMVPGGYWTAFDRLQGWGKDLPWRKLSIRGKSCMVALESETQSFIASCPAGFTPVLLRVPSSPTVIETSSYYERVPVHGVASIRRSVLEIIKSPESVLRPSDIGFARREIGPGTSVTVHEVVLDAKGKPSRDAGKPVFKTSTFGDRELQASDQAKGMATSILKSAPGMRTFQISAPAVFTRISGLQQFIASNAKSADTFILNGERGQLTQGYIERTKSLASDLRTAYESSGFREAYRDLRQTLSVLEQIPQELYPDGFASSLQEMRKHLSAVCSLVEGNLIDKLCEGINDHANSPEGLWDYLHGSDAIVLAASVAAGVVAGMMIPLTGGGSTAVALFIAKNVAIAAGGYVGKELSQTAVSTFDHRVESDFQKYLNGKMTGEEYGWNALQTIAMGATTSAVLGGVGRKVGEWAKRVTTDPTVRVALTEKILARTIVTASKSLNLIDDAIEALGSEEGAILGRFVTKFLPEYFEEALENFPASLAANADAVGNETAANALKATGFVLQILNSAKGVKANAQGRMRVPIPPGVDSAVLAALEKAGANVFMDGNNTFIDIPVASRIPEGPDVALSQQKAVEIQQDSRIATIGIQNLHCSMKLLRASQTKWSTTYGFTGLRIEIGESITGLRSTGQHPGVIDTQLTTARVASIQQNSPTMFLVTLENGDRIEFSTSQSPVVTSIAEEGPEKKLDYLRVFETPGVRGKIEGLLRWYGDTSTSKGNREGDARELLSLMKGELRLTDQLVEIAVQATLEAHGRRGPIKPVVSQGNEAGNAVKLRIITDALVAVGVKQEIALKIAYAMTDSGLAGDAVEDLVHQPAVAPGGDVSASPIPTVMYDDLEKRSVHPRTTEVRVPAETPRSTIQDADPKASLSEAISLLQSQGKLPDGLESWSARPLGAGGMGDTYLVELQVKSSPTKEGLPLSYIQTFVLKIDRQPLSKENAQVLSEQKNFDQARAKAAERLLKAFQDRIKDQGSFTIGSAEGRAILNALTSETMTIAAKAQTSVDPTALWSKVRRMALETPGMTVSDAVAAAVRGGHDVVDMKGLSLTLPDGRRCTAMPVLGGCNLDDVQHQVTSPAGKVAMFNLALGAAASLSDLAHLDLKPANFLLSVSPDGKVVSMNPVDFGLATEHGTQTKTAMGTPAYMAPEAFDPSKPKTTTSDVYALGCVLTQILTGKTFNQYVMGDDAKPIEYAQQLPSLKDARILGYVTKVVAGVEASDPKVLEAFGGKETLENVLFAMLRETPGRCSMQQAQQAFAAAVGEQTLLDGTTELRNIIRQDALRQKLGKLYVETVVVPRAKSDTVVAELNDPEAEKSNVAGVKLGEQERSFQDFRGDTSEVIVQNKFVKRLCEIPNAKIRVRGDNGALIVSLSGDGVYGEILCRRTENTSLMVVESSNVTKGFGPLLYDVAMEVATKNGYALVSDRKRVSPDAFNVWQFYYFHRQDVERVPLRLSEWYEGRLAKEFIDTVTDDPASWPEKSNPIWSLLTGFKKQTDVTLQLEAVGKIEMDVKNVAMQSDNNAHLDSQSDWLESDVLVPPSSGQSADASSIKNGTTPRISSSRSTLTESRRPFSPSSQSLIDETYAKCADQSKEPSDGYRRKQAEVILRSVASDLGLTLSDVQVRAGVDATLEAHSMPGGLKKIGEQGYEFENSLKVLHIAQALQKAGVSKLKDSAGRRPAEVLAIAMTDAGLAGKWFKWLMSKAPTNAPEKHAEPSSVEGMLDVSQTLAPGTARHSDASGLADKQLPIQDLDTVERIRQQYRGINERDGLVTPDLRPSTTSPSEVQSPEIKSTDQEAVIAFLFKRGLVPEHSSVTCSPLGVGGEGKSFLVTVTYATSQTLDHLPVLQKPHTFVLKVSDNTPGRTSPYLTASIKKGHVTATSDGKMPQSEQALFDAAQTSARDRLLKEVTTMHGSDMDLKISDKKSSVALDFIERKIRARADSAGTSIDTKKFGEAIRLAAKNAAPSTTVGDVVKVALLGSFANKTLDGPPLELPDGRGITIMPIMGTNNAEQITKNVLLSDEAKVALLNLQVRAAASVANSGIIHHDLKPLNMMLSVGEDGALTVALIDFGMATTKTQSTASAIGTYPYISPENARSQVMGAKTDVFAAGNMLVETLMGATLNNILSEADDPKRRIGMIEALQRIGQPTIDETIHKILNSVEKQNPKIVLLFGGRENLQRILTGMLQVDPDKRWTMQQAQEELANAISRKTMESGVEEIKKALVSLK